MDRASILGIYGQNGSGKTVIIETLAILKLILTGRQIPSSYIESIRFASENLSIEVEFPINGNDNTDCIAIYSCTLNRLDEKNENAPVDNAEISEVQSPIIVVSNETLKVSGYINDNKYPMQNIAQTNRSEPLIRPKQKCRLLFGDNEKILKTLQIKKALVFFHSRSFIFSRPATDVIRSIEKNDFGTIILLLQYFSEHKLFIKDGDVQSDAPLTINFVSMNKDGRAFGHIRFSLESKASVPERGVEIVDSFLPPLNIVLSSMFPGLTIGYKSQKLSLDEKDDNYEIELFASRNEGHEYPLRHESLGIKKIISFLSLLIATHNDPGCVLAVDEFDSSVFEFLLGELVSVIKESGCGQLIFTSHNLRPLEKLDDTSICFTTTDPNNRYIKLKKKATNNLRDMYFRIISLGTNDFDLYSSKSKYALALAFRQVGWKE
jgi:ABC-type dipeptide/oligopeptide/nickel transport system ATPase component